MSRSRFVPTSPPGASVARASRVVLVAIIALPLALLQAGCDSGSKPPPPEPPENVAPTAQLSASATNVHVGESVTFDGSGSTDADGTVEDYDWQLSSPAGSEVSLEASGDEAELTADVAGEYGVDLTITDDDGATDAADVSVRVDMPDPESITLTLEIQAADGDSLVTTDVQFSGETVATDFAAGEVTLAFSEDPGALCALATEFFVETCRDVTPDRDFEDVLALTRKTVELDVSIEPEDAEVVVTDRDGQTLERVGSFVADVRKLSGDREVEASADGYEPEMKTVAADVSHALSFDLVEIPPQPACSDGLDNEGDGLVDADDFGCLSPDGVYEPEDDNEHHRVFTRAFGGAGVYEPYFVSSDPEHWEGLGTQTEFPSSIQVAVEFYSEEDIKVSSEQTGEAYTRRFACGSSRDDQPHVNFTDLVPDDGADGWITVELQGMERSWFTEGSYCTFTRLHEAYINDEPGDGNDDVVFGTPDHLGSSVIAWIYDPDNVPGAGTATQPQSLTRTLEVGGCRETAAGEVCADVVPEWLDR